MSEGCASKRAWQLTFADVVEFVRAVLVALDVAREGDARLQLALEDITLVQQEDERGALQKSAHADCLPEVEGVELWGGVVSECGSIVRDSAYQSIEPPIFECHLIKGRHRAEEEYSVD